MRVVWILTLACSWFMTVPVLAFKIGTHLWVGKEVLKNLHSCYADQGRHCVETPYGDSTQIVSIPTMVSAVIMENPEFYMMGNIGPDAFPDILIGQSVIHPGITEKSSAGYEVATGFGTSDWLAHLLRRAQELPDSDERRKATAFVYGFLGHAAADVFAHTYVNTYAGDVFSFAGGETDVELRHVALEDYIQAHTPEVPTSDSSGNGQSTGLASQLYYGDEPAIPLEFIRKNLLFDEVAIEQLRKTGVVGSHVVHVYDLYREIQRALVQLPSNMNNVDYAQSIAKTYFDTHYSNSDSEESTAEGIFKIAQENFESDAPKGGSLQQAEVLAVQIVVYYYFKIKLNQQQATKTSELLNRFMVYQSKTVGEWDRKRGEMDQIVLEGAQLANRVHPDAVDRIQSASQRFNRSLNMYASYVANAQKASRDHSAAKVNLANKRSATLCQIAAESSCESMVNVSKKVSYPCTKCKKKIGDKCIHVVPDTCYKDVSSLVKKIDPTCAAARSQCAIQHQAHAVALSQLQKDVTATEAALLSANKAVISEEGTAKREFDLVNNALAELDASAKSTFQTLKALESNILAVSREMTEGHRAIISKWEVNIEDAMREYIRANGKAIINSVDEDDTTTIWAPLSNWSSCFMPSIVGIPQVVLSATTCAAEDLREKYDRFYLKLEEEVRRVDPHVGGLVLKARDRFRKAAAFQIASKVGEAFDRITGNRFFQGQMTAHVVMNEVSDDDLNRIFSEDRMGKKLLRFGSGSGSIVARVQTDMGFPGDGKFDYRFATASNAVTFAALALADSTGIENLGPSGLMGQTLHLPNIANLLTRSLRSIDGSYQWMNVAPPFPRSGSAANDGLWKVSFDNPLSVDRRFGYQVSDAESGFPLFRLPELRRDIFEKVFQGPMNPGLFESDALNMPDMLPADYNFRPTHLEPFGK